MLVYFSIKLLFSLDSTPFSVMMKKLLCMTKALNMNNPKRRMIIMNDICKAIVTRYSDADKENKR